MKAPPARCLVLLLTFLALSSIVQEADGLKTSLKCPMRVLKGGRVRLRSKDRVAKYVCLRGAQVLGERYSMCIRGKWDTPVPICINKGCLPVTVAHGQVLDTYGGALVTVHCDPGYALVGSQSIYCNGAVWNDTAPTCREIQVRAQRSCDFESEDLCGWTHDRNHDFDWRRHNFATPSGHVGTGPSFDHTYGSGLNGHYMYLEVSSPRMENDTARLFSPVFDAITDSGSCFIFWYHMYGITTGTLNVYIHKQDIVLLFSKSGDQGNQWLQAVVPLPPINSRFQIVIEGVRGSGYEGDIAIDDVKLAEGEECSGPTSSTTTDDMATVTVNEESASSCEGRCLSPAAEPSMCECTSDCLSNNTCCPDYVRLCSIGISEAKFGVTTEKLSTRFMEVQNKTETSKKLVNSTIGILAPTQDYASFTDKPSNKSQDVQATTLQNKIYTVFIPPSNVTVILNSKPTATAGVPSVKWMSATERITTTQEAKQLVTKTALNSTSTMVADQVTAVPKTTKQPVITSTSMKTSITPKVTTQLAKSILHDKTPSVTVKQVIQTTPEVIRYPVKAKQQQSKTKPPVTAVPATPVQWATSFKKLSPFPTFPTSTNRSSVIRRPKIEFVRPPPPVLFRTPTSTARTTSKLIENVNVTTIRTTLNSRKTFGKKEKAKSKNNIFHPVWFQNSTTTAVMYPLGPKPGANKTSSAYLATPSTWISQQLKSSQTTTGARWRSKYKPRDEAPVHAQFARPTPSSGHSVHILVLVSGALLVIVMATAVVCTLRRRKINRRRMEDDELDIQFLASDEILDFTLARPSMEDIQMSERRK